MQNVLKKRSFWVALILILLLVGFSARYLITEKEKVGERVEPLISREKEVEEALVREEVQVPAMAVAARVLCPTIDIVSPRDGILLIDIDDSNPEKKGYQIRVKAKTDAEEGRAVILRVNDLGPVSAAVKKGSAFFREVDLMEGPNTLVATVTSESGCAGESRPVRVVVDTRAPIVKIISPFDGAILNKTDITVTGEARDEGRKVTFVTVNDVRAELKGEKFKAILASQPPGPLEITATAGDRLAKVATHTIRITISLDKPFINITSPREGERLSTSSLVVKGDFGNFSHPARVKITVNGKAAEIDLSNNEYYLTLTGLSDGSLTVTAIATDGIITAKAIRNVVLDTRAPSIRIDAPLNNEIFAVPTVLVSGSVNDPQPGSGIELVTVNGYEATVSDGEFSFALGNLGPCFVELEIMVEARDNAGNLAISETVVVTVDTESPVVEVTNPQMGLCLNTPEVEVNVTAVEACSGINWVEVNGVPAAIEGGVFTAVLPGGACIDPLTITAVAADWAGNQGTSEPVEVTVDTEEPEVFIDSAEAGRDMSDNQPVRGRVLDTCSGAALVMVNNQDATYTPGTGTFSAELERLNEGPLQLTAQADDRCGNQGIHTMGVNVVHCPWVNIISPSDGQDFNATEVEVSGKFGCFQNPGAVRVTAWIGEGNALPATVRGEDYTVLLNGLPQGRQNMTVIATDGAKEAAAIVHIRVDTVPPEINITVPDEGAGHESLEIPIEGTASDVSSGVKVILVNGVEATGPPFAPGEVGNWSAVLENQPEGRLDIQATATDGMGWNSSDSVYIDLSYPPALLGPGGVGCYGTIDTDTGAITYDCEDFDFGVPREGDFGIGTARNFRPGDRVTLPINVNMGDDGILMAWTITLEYDKNVLINPHFKRCYFDSELRRWVCRGGSDSWLPSPYYSSTARRRPLADFNLNEPDEPAVLYGAYSSNLEPTGQKNICNLTFTISEDAQPGYYPLSFGIRVFKAWGGLEESPGKEEDGETPLVYDIQYDMEGNPISGMVVVRPE